MVCIAAWGDSRLQFGVQPEALLRSDMCLFRRPVKGRC